MNERFLSHFTFLSYTEHFWTLPQSARKQLQAPLLEGLRDASERFDLYQVFPGRSDTDLLVWANQTISDSEEPAHFFNCLGKVLNGQRAWLRPVHTLWGFTGASSYARGKSAQAIDPLATERKPYLIVYPFVKTVDWYRLSRDARQGMMNEHIRIGHQYEEITQLLLYSTGLQDQEFVVVYESDNLTQFSELVAELRGSEARRFTERDTPIFTAFYNSPEETLALGL